MKKNLPLNYAVIVILLYTAITNTACRKDSSSPIQTELKPYTGNIQFEFLPQSIEKIMTAEMPWEAKSLNFYNVIKGDTGLHMFYNSFAYNQLDFDGSFCLAQSKSGNTWNRTLITNNTNILIGDQKQKGIMGSFVFTDSLDAIFRYKMICIKLVNGNQKTFLYASPDGIKWTIVKQLFNTMQDSQFSVIRMYGEYYVFVRYNNYKGNFQRAIGLATLDNNFNVIQQPNLLLKAPANDAFPHIYNNAASKVNDSMVLFFPTYYNDNNGNIQIRLLYSNNLKDYYLVDNNINKYLFPDGNINWAIVSPGLIAADEKDTYWLYYYGTPSHHDDFVHSSSFKISYYRIKLVVHQ
jgi:hypothetical protein